MIPKDFYYFVVSGFLLMLLPLGLIAWFQAGFFTKWLKVRASRGRLSLVKIRNKLLDRWDYGEIKGDFLIYGKGENKKRIALEDGQVYRCFGVTVLDTDETSNAVCSVDYKAVPGFVAEKFEDLYVRALFRPALDQDQNRILIIIAVVIIAGLAINAFLVWSVSQQISALGPATINSVI